MKRRDTKGGWGKCSPPVWGRAKNDFSLVREEDELARGEGESGVGVWRVGLGHGQKGGLIWNGLVWGGRKLGPALRGGGTDGGRRLLLDPWEGAKGESSGGVWEGGELWCGLPDRTGSWGEQKDYTKNLTEGGEECRETP